MILNLEMYLFLEKKTNYYYYSLLTTNKAIIIILDKYNRVSFQNIVFGN